MLRLVSWKISSTATRAKSKALAGMPLLVNSPGDDGEVEGADEGLMLVPVGLGATCDSVGDASWTGVDVAAIKMPLEVATSRATAPAKIPARGASRCGAIAGLGICRVVGGGFSTKSTLGMTNCMGRLRR